MKINDNGSADNAKINRVSTAATRDTKKADEAAASVSTKAESDSVKLSSVSQQVRAEATTAPVNNSKIKEILSAIEDGSFKIKPDVIANALLKLSKETSSGEAASVN